MTGHHRSRRLAAAALTAVFPLVLAACSTDVPNTTFQTRSEFGQAIDALTYRLVYLGTGVGVLVAALLVYVVWRFRSRPGNLEPKQIHGHTTLEIVWTLVPAVILAFIAVPTIRTIFQTQAQAIPGALQVEVIGHQWWWEFRYPQYNVTTANELYLPVGRTANLALRTADVLHSFWVPRMGGKRDLISNHTNYIWFTPDSAFAWNGICAEYCGHSHANMRFKVFTVPPAEFERWIAHQRGPAAQTAPVAYTLEQLPPHIVPNTPIPSGVDMPDLAGDAARGAQLYARSACIGCHYVQGVSPGIVGPNLTHVGSRTTIAAGMYPNDMRHLARWLKNAPAMKPGSLMPPMGRGLPNSMGNLDDQQIADIAAYLLSLK
ncbi:MAG: cytochrome c oxidase subunit II [Gemmatimonadaceae bacterium]